MFEKIMKKNREKMSKIDFIQKNLELVQVDQEENYNQKLFKIRTTWNRIESAKHRKTAIEDEERKKKVFMLYRWDILKEKKKEMYTEKLKEKMEKYRKRFWV